MLLAKYGVGWPLCRLISYGVCGLRAAPLRLASFQRFAVRIHALAGHADPSGVSSPRITSMGESTSLELDFFWTLTWSVIWLLLGSENDPRDFETGFDARRIFKLCDVDAG